MTAARATARGNSSAGASAVPTISDAQREYLSCLANSAAPEGCFPGLPADPAAAVAAPGAPGAAAVIAPITVADLVNFDPTVGSHHMEPDGWSIIDLDTNFFVTAGVEVQAGELVGLPASVRFTPAAYHWDYGDGTSATLLQPGASWAAGGVGEFDDTPTSHVFTSGGRVTITLTVDYSAEYSFDGSGWVAIDGVVPVVADTLTATVSDASTLLVGGGCTGTDTATDIGTRLGC